ncbi:hypothetical protein L3Y34_002421 [Caenorhabditis briggsae]|uniref:Uncharacterized protein n=1 Tax=Caenorhabditis briggsae TaxID=6238 RepID=A0AAE9DEP2_CAEBR|nr:hypothetical protein L3Y34_002421 [Caenorhabditis briggsae]
MDGPPNRELTDEDIRRFTQTRREQVLRPNTEQNEANEQNGNEKWDPTGCKTFLAICISMAFVGLFIAFSLLFIVIFANGLPTSKNFDIPENANSNQEIIRHIWLRMVNGNSSHVGGA